MEFPDTSDGRPTDFDGLRYSIHGNSPYYRNSRGETLHRKVWEGFCDTAVPAGWVVHHIDGDPGNNDPLNLEALPEKAHSKKHDRLLKRGRPERR